jgi:hypothetical protein
MMTTAKELYAQRLTWYRDIGQPDLVQRWENTPTRWPAEQPSYSRPDRAKVKYLGRVLVSQAQDGLVQQSQQQLALELDETPRVIGAAMRWLEHVGWLELVKKAVGPGRGGSTTGQGRPAVYRITALAAHVAGLAELSTPPQETGTPQGVGVLEKQVPQESETGTPRAETLTPMGVPSSVFSSDSSSRVKVSEQAQACGVTGRQKKNEEELRQAVQAALQSVAQANGAKNPKAYIKALKDDRAGPIDAACSYVRDTWPYVPRHHHELQTYLVAKIKDETISPALYQRLNELNVEHHPPPELRAIS